MLSNRGRTLVALSAVFLFLATVLAVASRFDDTIIVVSLILILGILASLIVRNCLSGKPMRPSINVTLSVVSIIVGLVIIGFVALSTATTTIYLLGMFFLAVTSVASTPTKSGSEVSAGRAS